MNLMKYTKYIFIVIIVLFVTSPIAISYSGFCMAEKRWLSDEEMFDIAIRETFKNYPPKRSRIKGTVSKKIERPVKYEDFDDFVRRNPNCCSWLKTDPLAREVGFWYWVNGNRREFVLVEYAADADDLDPQVIPSIELNAIAVISSPRNRDIDPEIRKNFNAIWYKFNKPFYDILESRNSSTKPKEIQFQNLLEMIKQDFNNIVESHEISETERNKIMELYTNYKSEINLKNRSFVYLSNCGKVYNLD